MIYNNNNSIQKNDMFSLRLKFWTCGLELYLNSVKIINSSNSTFKFKDLTQIGFSGLTGTSQHNAELFPG